MDTRRHRLARCSWVLVLALALTGCSGDDDPDPVQQRDRNSSVDAPDTGGHGDSGSAVDGSAGGSPSALVEQALAAQADNEPTEFASLLAEAAEACAEPEASRRLVEVSLIAERWSSALADGRPKVQAVTEDQLAQIDWEQLSDACSGA